MNHNVTGKLQVTLLLAYIFRKKFCSLIFKASSEEIIVMYCEKLKAKSMKDGSGYSSWKKLVRLTKLLCFHLFQTLSYLTYHMYHYQSSGVRILYMPSIFCCCSSINKNKQDWRSNVLLELKTESQWKDSNPLILSYCQLL